MSFTQLLCAENVPCILQRAGTYYGKPDNTEHRSRPTNQAVGKRIPDAPIRHGPVFKFGDKE